MIFLRGMAMAASLIVAIGPQNALLIRLGLGRLRGVFAIAAIYVTIDAVLIAVGALGVGSAISSVPLLKFAFSLFAAGFFVVFGLRSLLNAARGTAQFDVEDGQATVRKAVLVSLLNPGVIFDTIVLVGGVAAQYADLTQRAIFSLGAVAASSLWFATLAVASYTAGRYVTGAQVWRILDLVVGLLMLILAATLVQDAVAFATARWG